MKCLHSKIFFIVIAAALVAAPSTAWAQWRIGVNGGYTHNSLTTSSGYTYDRNYTGSDGFTVNAVAGYQFMDWFSVNAELGYIEKSYKYSRSIVPAEYDNSTVRNGYLQLPIYASFSFGGKRLRGFTNLGAYFNYWASSHVKGSVMGINTPGGIYFFDEAAPFDSRRDNRLECGLMAGVGLQFAASKLVTVFAEGRFYYSLTDMQKQYMEKQMPRYNNTIAIQVGVKFTIGQSKSKTK